MPRTSADVTGFYPFVTGDSSGEAHFNAAMRQLDMIVQASVIDKDLTAPPGSPSDGDCYYVASGATGDWSGQDGNLAQWFDDPGEWLFANAAPGYVMWVQDESAFYRVTNAEVLTAGPT